MRAQLNDRTITKARLLVPAWGLPFAEVEIDGAEELADNAVTLEIADLVASMTVVTSGAWRGRRRYRLVAGSGGWGESIPARGYTSDLKVLRGAVATDAAADAGELIDTSGLSVDSIGGHWTRPAGPAARTLELLAPQGWRVGLDGFTRFGAVPEVDYTGEAARVDLPDFAVGRIELAPSTGVSQLIPGVVVDDTTAVDVEHRVEDGALRTSLWAAHGGASRVLKAMERLVTRLTDRYRYHGAYSYRIVSSEGSTIDGQRLDLQPERSSTGMPWLQRVRTQYLPGITVEHTLGGLVLVQFADGDPARPRVTAGDADPDNPGWLPDAVRIDADAAVELGDGIAAVLTELREMTIAGTLGGSPVVITQATALITGPPGVPRPKALS
jgi:hypothetical protein